jgi:hypothetical protein
LAFGVGLGIRIDWEAAGAKTQGIRIPDRGIQKCIFKYLSMALFTHYVVFEGKCMHNVKIRQAT